MDYPRTDVEVRVNLDNGSYVGSATLYKFEDSQNQMEEVDRNEFSFAVE
jgi:hypothetical protein